MISLFDFIKILNFTKHFVLGHKSKQRYSSEKENSHLFTQVLHTRRMMHATFFSDELIGEQEDFANCVMLQGTFRVEINS